MLTIDGSRGEGGGQILRTCLSLSLVTGRPFRIEKIRAGRRNPGLQRQHLAAVRAATAVGQARTEGDAIGSSTLVFRPRSVRPGAYHFSTGSAGSTTLVLQTVLPALLTATGPSEIRAEGGTHNPAAPPFEFLDRCFLPLINRMGPRVAVRLERAGFYPAGGGVLTARITPAEELAGFDLRERGAVRVRRAVAAVARLPESIARRELDEIARLLGWGRGQLELRTVRDSAGPGNVVLIEIGSEHAVEIVAGFGMKGVSAESVARGAAKAARRYLDAGVPVGLRLADQLLVPLALSGRGSFRTLCPSSHTRTNAEVLSRFLEIAVRVSEQSPDVWTVTLDRAGP